MAILTTFGMYATTTLVADVVSVPPPGAVEVWPVADTSQFPAVGGGVTDQFYMSVTRLPLSDPSNMYPEVVAVSDTTALRYMTVSRGVGGSLVRAHRAGEVLTPIPPPVSVAAGHPGKTATTRGPFRVTHDMAGLAGPGVVLFTPNAGDMMVGLVRFVVEAFDNPGTLTPQGVGTAAMFANSAQVPLLLLTTLIAGGSDYLRGLPSVVSDYVLFTAASPVFCQISGSHAAGIVDLYVSILPA